VFENEDSRPSRRRLRITARTGSDVVTAERSWAIAAAPNAHTCKTLQNSVFKHRIAVIVPGLPGCAVKEIAARVWLSFCQQS
jgi:hypothetical protein